jgi:hypothetical protein
VKVAIAVAAKDTVHTVFAQCLAGLVGYSTARGTPVQVLFSGGTLIAPQRADLAAEAVNLGADAILWLDSDMVFPVDALEKLIEHGKDIVACNYSTRREPLSMTAFLEGNETLWIEDDSTGLAEVVSCGMGVMLTSAKVFTSMTDPWFDVKYNEDTKDWQGEDIYFCAKARKVGFDIYVDQDLSKEIGHLGTFEFRHGHANAWRGIERVD